MKEHIHQWQPLFTRISDQHQEGNKYLSYVIVHICECGAYTDKEFLHIEDLKNKGDGQKE